MDLYTPVTFCYLALVIILEQVPNFVCICQFNGLKFVVDTLNNVPKRTEEDLLNLQLEGGACSLKQFSPILQQQEPPHPRVQDFLHWIFTEQTLRISIELRNSILADNI
ncbi:hypothetical protein OUZ56_024806 [Daphnia magna]|uniref:Uncharacterized protein n=1 Tax=Daphnia magna TaxID=35525 RepID=A0ABQ9ZJ33_9CRUS|nr:hypothetical protein OUZ56_024806 [Daphnia magna]